MLTNFIFTFAIFFLSPPKPYLWKALGSSPSYHMREAVSRVISQDPRQRWWILRGTVLGSSEVCSRCRWMLLGVQCSNCWHGWCIQWRGYQWHPEDGRNIDVWEPCQNCGGTPHEHGFGDGWDDHWRVARRCRRCRGIGFRFNQ